MELPVIDFDGIPVSPKHGYYFCPYNCHDPRFPRKKWKTEKGFMNHMKSCPKSIDATAKKTALASARKEKFEAEKKIALLECPYNIGDRIWYVHTTVMKPTHENRNGRSVRVRYEQVCSFDARCIRITKIDYDGELIYNGVARPRDICSDEQSAKAECVVRFKGQTQYIEFSQRCR